MAEQTPKPKLRIITPVAFAPLLPPNRYKGARGGRGSAKSHFFAEMVIERCMMQWGLRVVCIREIQKSLRDSVKKLLEDKIKALNVGAYFRVMDTEIRTPGGGVIIFVGMQNHTAQSIKSLEGFDIAWFEEAQTMSAFSLSLLRPTIRKPGSEIWFSWNPYDKTDPVEVLFASNKSDSDFVCVTVTFRDNPWFPEVLRKEMERDRLRDPDRYAHVWLGKYQKISSARVFRNFKIVDFVVPKGTQFRFGGDFGFSVDPTVLIRCFLLNERTLCFDYEAWKVGCEIDHTPALFAGSDARNPPRWANPYGWQGIPEATKWPMVLDSSNPQAISYLRRHGFDNAFGAVKGPGSVEEGVTFLKGYDILIHPRCFHVADEFVTYSYEVDQRTEEVLPVLADKKNHTIDSARYAVEPFRRQPRRAAFGVYGSGR